jgi:predicted GIY-YIG superfamily endonuclease
MTTCVYALELEHNKWFIGASKDPEKALIEHQEGLGPLWTRIHRPLDIAKKIPFQREEDIDKYVKEFMRMKGLENVRGGSYSDARLKDSDRHALHHEMHSESDCVVA